MTTVLTVGGVGRQQRAADTIDVEPDEAEETLPFLANNSSGGVGRRHANSPTGSTSQGVVSNTTAITTKRGQVLWFLLLFLGFSLAVSGYAKLLDITFRGGRQLHELSFTCVTSGVAASTAGVTGHLVERISSSSIRNNGNGRRRHVPFWYFVVLCLSSALSSFLSRASLQ